MYKKENNYAFVDAQNIYRGTKEIGLNIDWKKFRIYLKEKIFCYQGLYCPSLGVKPPPSGGPFR